MGSNDAHFDRRTFLKGVTTVGAAAWVGPFANTLPVNSQVEAPSEATTDFPPTHSVVLLKEEVRLTAVIAAISGLGLRPLDFWHSAPPAGGFHSLTLSPEQAESRYVEHYAADHATNEEPRVYAFRVQGTLPEGGLGVPITDQVLAVRAIDAASVVVASAPGTDGERAVILARSDNSMPTLSDSTSSATTTAPRPWSPLNGKVNAFEDCSFSRPRIIKHTLRWADQAAIDAFGTDSAYEHDFKLYNDAIDEGKRPFCKPWQQNDFWAVRDGWSWSHNFPSNAKAYVDTEWLDSCRQLDLTMGLYRPQFLQHSTDYTITFNCQGAEHIDASAFTLLAQLVKKDCPHTATFDIESPWCVGTLQQGDSQELILRSHGKVVPGCHSWQPGQAPAQCL